MAFVDLLHGLVSSMAGLAWAMLIYQPVLPTPYESPSAHRWRDSHLLNADRARECLTAEGVFPDDDHLRSGGAQNRHRMNPTIQ